MFVDCPFYPGWCWDKHWLTGEVGTCEVRLAVEKGDVRVEKEHRNRKGFFFVLYSYIS